MRVRHPPRTASGRHLASQRPVHDPPLIPASSSRAPITSRYHYYCASRLALQSAYIAWRGYLCDISHPPTPAK